MNLSSPIQYIPKVGPVMAGRLKKLNVLTVEDLLWHLPFRYDDLSLISEIASVQSQETVTAIGTVVTAKNQYTRNRKQIQTVTVKDETGLLQAIWFNQPFIIKNVQVGDQLAVSGTVEKIGSKTQILSPVYETVVPGKKLLHTGKIIPVYPETEGISSKWLRGRIDYIINNFKIEEYLPSEILTKYNFPEILSAFKNIHQPESMQPIDNGRQRLAFDELLTLEIIQQTKRREWQKQILSSPLKIDKTKISEFISSLPFNLTKSQVLVTDEILSDLAKNKPMNRILEGDVGSGKTVVGAIAIYATYLNGLNSVIMAPTEILAEQHFQTLKKLLEPFGLKIGLLTSSHKISRIHNPCLAGRQAESRINVIIGTYALLEKKVNLDKVKLIIIDEQHRFGVKQRSILREKGDTPHVLTMTATPIPRTIALTLYGDLDLSVINEMPMGRKTIKTWVVPPVKRNLAYEWIRKQILENESQAFIVCPFIEPSETFSSIKAATEEFIKLKKQIFPDLKLALLHGNIKSKEKIQILTDFKNNKYDILVATPVVEVGIDIPRATIMMIEAAERFGLAQLHQLRGRVGRNDKQAYCLLFTSMETKTDITRLKYMQTTLDGPKLAELDLKIRGPGNIFGEFQHGRNFLKVANFSDLEIINKAKNEAQKLISCDPKLDKFPILKERLKLSTISDIVPN